MLRRASCLAGPRKCECRRVRRGLLEGGLMKSGLPNNGILWHSCGYGVTPLGGAGSPLSQGGRFS